MPYTTHGHWYGPGSPTLPGPRLVAKCSAFGACEKCRVEAGMTPFPPQRGAPPVPPSIEQNVQEVRAWAKTPDGRALAGTHVAEDLAESMARHCGIDSRILGEVMVRLSSHMAATIVVAPDMSTWMMTNLVAMAGVNLIDKDGDGA